MNTLVRGAAKPSQEYPTALAKDVDPDGTFERAYAEAAGTVVVDEPVRGADLATLTGGKAEIVDGFGLAVTVTADQPKPSMRLR